MSDVITSRPAPKTTAEYKAAITELLVEIQRINDAMQQNRAEIERSKRETDRIKAETEVIKARARARLDALKAAL